MDKGELSDGGEGISSDWVKVRDGRREELNDRRLGRDEWREEGESELSDGGGRSRITGREMSGENTGQGELSDGGGRSRITGRGMSGVKRVS